MTAEPHKLDDVSIGVEPYQQIVVLDMALHAALVLAFKRVGLEIGRNGFLLSEQFQHFLQCFHLRGITFVPLIVLLEFTR